MLKIIKEGLNETSSKQKDIKIARKRASEIEKRIKGFQSAYSKGKRDLPYLDMIENEKEELDKLVLAIMKAEKK